MVSHGANLMVFAKATAFQSGVCSILANLVTQAEELRDLREVFVSWDDNSDGFLSLEELKSNMHKISSYFSLNESDIREMMKAADTNGDGLIDYTEFITAAFDKSKLLSQENMRKAFDLLDSNGDGEISVDEFRMSFENTATAGKGAKFWDEVIA